LLDFARSAGLVEEADWLKRRLSTQDSH
jgi:hypothetical protein